MRTAEGLLARADTTCRNWPRGFTMLPIPRWRPAMPAVRLNPFAEPAMPKARPSRPLSLTPAHVARIHRVIEDCGVAPGAELHTDNDYAAWTGRVMAERPRDAPFLLFAYGSLIWKPELQHVASAPAVARGWHRAFCLRMPRFRGTVEAPGLMMALDRGGQCRGMVYELPAEDLEGQLGKLFRREFTFKPINNMPRWISVETASGPAQALTFVINRASPLYAGRLPLDNVADTLSTACGHWGTGAEYLMNTVAQLESLGIRDRNLWRLQRLVAARIEAAGHGDPATA